MTGQLQGWRDVKSRVPVQQMKTNQFFPFLAVVNFLRISIGCRLARLDTTEGKDRILHLVLQKAEILTATNVFQSSTSFLEKAKRQS